MKFGSSGVRGAWGEDVTVEMALGLGRALGHLHEDVLVARDGRTSGPVLEEAVVSGLLAGGASVTRGGVASTPALAWGTRRADAGVGLTASHNPASHGGFKLWTPTGQGFPQPWREEVTRLVEDPPEPASWDRMGSVEGEVDLAREHVEMVLEHVPERDLGLRVAVDGGNGPAGAETARILRALGCEVVTLNAQVDGAFPGRPSEPTPRNLRDLRKLLSSGGFDLGLAHDGDGDRLVALQGDGTVVPGDVLLVLLARWSGADTVACPVDATMAVEDALDARVVRTPVGDVHVSAALAEEAGGFGGEASGCWILPEAHLCPDGPLAAAAVASLAAERSMGERVREVPTYPLRRESVPVAEDAKPRVMQELAGRLSAWGEVSTLDGVRVETEDAWVLVRPSGTEPVVRVTVEARSETTRDVLVERALKELESVIREVT